jgi:hypothetical protein
MRVGVEMLVGVRQEGKAKVELERGDERDDQMEETDVLGQVREEDVDRTRWTM